MGEETQHKIRDIANKIYELQAKQNTLTNGQRYAAINEIEKTISPLRNDLYHLEHKLYSQETEDKVLKEQINTILEQINKLEDIKSDLNARIQTETEQTRQELNNKIIDFMTNELKPIKNSIDKNQEDIKALQNDITQLRMDIIEANNERDKREIARFDNIKLIITAVVAGLSGLSVLTLWLEPSIRTLISIFF